MAGTGTFGTFKLGVPSSEATLPSATAYHKEKIKQGGNHILLNGRSRADDFGDRYHFYLGWQGLTEAEADAIESAFYAAGVLSFMDHVDTYSVVRANISPRDYDAVGWVTMNLELEQTV
jgi:hypothetical protein